MPLWSAASPPSPPWPELVRTLRLMGGCLSVAALDQSWLGDGAVRATEVAGAET